MLYNNYHNKLYYRGGPQKTGPNNVFLTQDKNYAKTYGAVFAYIIREGLKIILLDSNSLTQLYNECNDENIKDILVKNYGVLNNFIRDSVCQKDKELCNYLSSLGYDGYYSDIKQTEFDILNEEIAIFDAQNIIFVEQISSDEEVEKCHKEYNLLMNNLSDKIKRKQPLSNITNENLNDKKIIRKLF